MATDRFTTRFRLKAQFHLSYPAYDVGMKDSMVNSNQTVRLIVQLVREFGLTLAQVAAIAMVPLEFVEMIIQQTPGFA